MDTTIGAALIGLGAAAIGGVAQAAAPALREWFSRRPAGHRLLGDWRSSWGAYPNGPAKFHETLTITKQRGEHIFAVITWSEYPHKKWAVEGRYDGHFLQLLYYPSPSSIDSDFLDHGCYFLKRTIDGSFVGYSTAHGPYEDNDEHGISVAYHELKRA